MKMKCSVEIIQRVGLESVCVLNLGEVEKISQCEKFRKQLADANPNFVLLAKYEEICEMSDVIQLTNEIDKNSNSKTD